MRSGVLKLFRNPFPLLDRLPDEYRNDSAFNQAHVIGALEKFDDAWGLFIDETVAHLVLSLVERVILYPDQMAIRWDLHGLAKLLREM